MKILFLLIVLAITLPPCIGQPRPVGVEACGDACLSSDPNVTRTVQTTTTARTRRRKTRLRRSATTTPTTLTTTRRQVAVDKTNASMHEAMKKAYLYMLFIWKYQQFYCMKWTECINDHLYFERYSTRVCGRDWTNRRLYYFDHLCTLWRANCKGIGMYFHKHRSLCDYSAPPVEQFWTYVDLDPPEVIHFSITPGFNLHG